MLFRVIADDYYHLLLLIFRLIRKISIVVRQNTAIAQV